MSERFDADWLALREPFDRAARSRSLAVRLAQRLPTRPRILDLGAGSGSLFRWLAPQLGRPQAWTLVDADRRLLEEAFSRTALWAEERGYRVTTPGRALLVHTPDGAWRVEALSVDFAADPADLPCDSHDVVVCSALLDLVSLAWLERFADALRLPLLACLTVDGRDAWLPPDPLDRLVARGVARDMGRDKGFGPALGQRAPARLLRMLADRGFQVASAPSNWIVPPVGHAMLEAMVRGHAAAAAAALPASVQRIAGWESRRMSLIARGRLALRIGHRDILALPGA